MSTGYDLEDDVQAVLVNMKAKQQPQMWFHRLTDSHAAGRFVRSQPSDFIVWTGGTSILIECKESVKEPGLNAAPFGKAEAKNQLAVMKQVVKAGNLAVFLFRNPILGVVEVVPADGITLNAPARTWLGRCYHTDVKEAVRSMMKV